MGNLVDLIKADVRYQDSLKACMNCGICTAICPAAEFFEYDPRRICDMVQRGDEDVIENMKKVTVEDVVKIAEKVKLDTIYFMKGKE